MGKNKKWHKVVSVLISLLFTVNNISFAVPDISQKMQKESALRVPSAGVDLQTAADITGRLSEEKTAHSRLEIHGDAAGIKFSGPDEKSGTDEKSSSTGTFTLDIEGIRCVISADDALYNAIPKVVRRDLKELLEFLETTSGSDPSFGEGASLQLIFKKLEGLLYLYNNSYGIYGMEGGRPAFIFLAKQEPATKNFILFPQQPMQNCER